MCPWQTEENVITVTAKDAGGETLQASVRVNAQTTDDFVLLVADLDSGIAPFETTLRIKGTVTLTDQSVAYSGPGTATFTHEADSDEYGIGIEESGVYKVSVTGLDLDGVSHTNTVSIVVWDESRLASLLKARWSEMRARLVQGDVQGALGTFHESSRESYNEIYSALSDTLLQIAAEMRDIGARFTFAGRSRSRRYPRGFPWWDRAGRSGAPPSPSQRAPRPGAECSRSLPSG